MIFKVEVDVALKRPPRADMTIKYVIDAASGSEAELTALEWACSRPGVTMPVASVVTDWSQ